MLKLATVFSGIGAVEHALERMGVKYEIVFASDIGDVDILSKKIKPTTEDIVWVLQGAKEIHNKEFFIEKNSDWAGLFIYDNGMIQGDIRKEKGRV